MANTNANGRVVAPAVLQPQLSTDVVGFNLENNQASTLGQQYITFQETFLPGEVAIGTDLVAIVNGQKIPVQMDVKTFNDDGSVRSALLTFQQPSIAAHSSLSFMLSTTGTDFTTGALSLANLNGSNYDLKISIALQGGSTVVLDAATLLQQALNAGTVSYWQSGPLATQGRVDVPIAGALHVTLDITRYADGSTSTDVQFNNDYAMQSVGGTAVYNVTIQQNGSTVLQQSNITEYQYQTWHTVVSTTGTAQANVVQDIDHLQDTGAIPNLDLAAGVDPLDLSAERITGNQILGPGSITQYMPTAGGRADIGLMPGWNAIWLITQDEQAAKYALAQADAAGSVPWHYFDPKTGTYLSVTDHPTLWADPRGTPTLTQQPSSSSGWTPEAAHQPDLSYVAYLMTGDRYYLDQLNAQATFAVFSDWNVLRQNGLGLVANGSDEVRAQAWSLRVIDEAAWANPAGSAEQTYFAKLADNNWSWLVSQIPIWTQQEGQAYGYVPGTYGNNSAMAPWQQDYFASVAIEAAQMGNADALTFLNWEANFLVGRFLNSASGFNPHDGVAYNLTVANGNGINYQTWAQIGQATVAAGNSNGSGWADGNFAELAAQTLAGIITLTGSAAATQAYNWLMSSGAPQITPNFVDPQFDVVPDQPVNTGNATLSIVAVNGTQSEGTTGATTPFTFTITRGGNTSIASSAGWAVTGSGANPAAGSDFAGSVLPSGTVSFAAGETSKTITVNVAGDTVVEPDEGFTVTLSNPAASTTIGTATASGTIRNDDGGQASLSIAALSADKVEGQSGSTAFTFTVTRGGNTSIASSAGWAVTGSGANPAAGSDFAGSVLPSGTVSFAAGETSKTITVNVAGDTVVEPDEGFTVTLSNPAASTTIGTATASGTIRNDETSQASLSIAALSADKVEGQSGSTAFTFTVTRGGNTSIASSAGWAVTGSGANPAAASDFAGSVLPSGTVSFTAGQTSKTITVNVAGETVVESDEGFTVTLSNPSSGATIATAVATGTIRNDDVPTTIEAFGATRLVKVGNQFQLLDASNSGPTVKYQGGVVTAGQFGAWTPLGAEKVGTGYQMVWQNGSADQYLVWSTDSNGNWKSQTDVGTGSSYALQSLEAALQQDFNHDGTTGLKTTTLETAGATDLVQVANEFFLRDGAGSGPSLKYGGSDVVAGQFGAWTPLGAEKVGTGYQMVWQNGSADQYLVWSTDSNGNWKSQTDVGTGSSYALQSLEATLQQDFNHDGTTGLKTTTLETAGATDLVQVANEFFLRDGAGSGPSLKYGGSDVVAGQFGAWTPLGAEKVGTGYQVVWQNGSADQYLVWSTDSNGNWKSQTDPVSGSSYALQSLEATLQQDFNHDGTTGLKTTTLETAGATDLVQVANEFFLRDGAGSGPSLKYGGSDVVAGQFGAWTPLGAEKVGTGYQMVWQNGSADQYVIWNTDSNGTWKSQSDPVSGSNPALKAMESILHQDLNHDTIIG